MPKIRETLQIGVQEADSPLLEMLDTKATEADYDIQTKEA
jgi:hypothetical protein